MKGKNILFKNKSTQAFKCFFYSLMFKSLTVKFLKINRSKPAQFEFNCLNHAESKIIKNDFQRS